MDAVVLAGGITGPEDPLHSYTLGKPKAVIEIAGKPMIQWVLDALGGANSIESVLVVGLKHNYDLTCDKPLDFLPDQGEILENVKTGLKGVSQRNPNAKHVIVSSSDIPAITPRIVDWRVQESLKFKADIDYTVVDRNTMETRFPGANRTFVKLKDYELCGGDLNVISVSVSEKEQLWTRLVAARKNVLKQAALVGFDILLLLLLGKLTLQDAERRVGKRLDVKGHACLSPYAELAMDMDKPHQLELLRQDLSQRRSPDL